MKEASAFETLAIYACERLKPVIAVCAVTLPLLLGLLYFHHQ